jgi:hypothetical protein
MQKLYTDIDYESFPVADLFLDLHWIQLPKARYREICEAQAKALHEERVKSLPAEHKIILVPADPNFSPTEADLWPIVNETVLSVVCRHRAVHEEVVAAVIAKVAEHRGWRNPYPVAPHSKPVKK